MNRTMLRSARRPAGRHSAVLSAALAIGAVGAAAPAAIVFVDASAPGPIHDGTSWTSAFTTLPPALIAATFGDQVWVADGTYRPTADADRALSFFLVDGVEMYGGFAGGEFSLFQRNIANHPAILSGDIGVPGLATDNSYHVIFANSLIGGSTTVDGFTITGGRADGPGQTNGGGMTLGSANPVFRNCRIVGNSASASGGGVSCISSLDATFINCDIVNNQAPSGAGLEFQNSGPVLVNCRLIGNVASAGGGGARFLGSFPTLVNCEIRNNRVSSGGTLFGQGGGMLVANNSIASVTNCTIAANGADDGGGVLIANSASVSLMNGIVYHNAAVGETGQAAQIRTISGGTVTANRSCVQGLVGALGGVGNIASDPQFDGQFVADPFAFTEAPARLRPGSPCIDAGSVTGLPADDYDLDGDLDFSEPIPFDGRGTARRFDDTVVADTGSGGAPVVDMGANEFSRGALILVDANASGAKTGVTWADAYTDLQEALAQMNDPDFGPGEIWVATGTYRPDESDRAASFDLFIDARLFGGFAGGESARRFRDPRANPTILSGDIGVPNDKGDNSFHVLRADGASISGSTIVDGFIITGGNADLVGGGALVTNGATPLLRNCRFLANRADVSGGGMLVRDGAGPILMNCTFAANEAASAGGIEVSAGSSAQIINSTIVRNIASEGGAAGVLVIDSNVTIGNCVLHGNESGKTGEDAQIALHGSTAAIDYSLIEGWTGDLGGQGNLDGDPAFANLAGVDGIVGTPDDDLTPSPCSSLLDAGSMALVLLDKDDADEDAIISESFPGDQALANRFVDVPGVDDADPDGLPVDIGAMEYQPNHSADLNGDGVVGPADLAMLLGDWGAGACGGGDLNGDGEIGPADLATLLGAWGTAG